MKKGKRIMAMLLSAALAVSMLPTAVFAAGTVSCTESGCNGTYDNGFCTKNDSHYQAATLNSDGYYEIGNAGQLYWVAKYINTNYSEDFVNAKLTADIIVNKNVLDDNYNLNSNSSSFRSWAPINTYYQNHFRGTFDGCGYTISGLYNNTANDHTGLFGIVSSDGGTVKNVTLKDTYFYSTADFCGGIAGANRGVITGCSVYASIIGNKNYLGAIAGVNYGTVTNCEFKAGNVSGISKVGGIVGQNGKGTVSKSKCHGSVSGSSYNSSNYIGGIVGQNDDNCTVSECESLATSVISVSSSSNYLGGIAGYNSGRIENCINRMSITVTEQNTVGGITANNSKASSTVIGCTNYGTITGASYISGIVSMNYGTVEKCGNEGSVTAKYGNRPSTVGGITGVCYDSGKILNCYNKGDISGAYQAAGGILGWINGSACEIKSCWNSGKVSSQVGYVGGILGHKDNSQCVSNCYYNSDLRATDSDGKEQNGIGANTNSTTADTAGITIAKNSIEFKTGAVAYLLNGGVTDGTQVWYQNIDNGQTRDEYPVLNSKSGTVYITSPCVSGTNNSASLKKEHNFQNGVCTGCGSACAHATVTNCKCSVCGATVHKYANGFCESNSSHYQEAKTDINNYYEIGNAGQLFWFAAQVNGGATSINGKLTADINLENKEWTAIGTEAKPYTGKFDGNGKTISGFKLTAKSSFQGLFGVVSGGIVKDLTVDGKIDITATVTNIGGVIGKVISRTSYSAEINNVVSRVTITDTRTVDTENRISGVGGITASSAGITENSVTTVTRFKNCSYYGNITIQCGSSVGGVVGNAQDTIILERCDNHGTVKSGGNSAHIGGVAGDAQTGATVKQCINYGNVTSGGADCIGGVVAYASTRVNIEYCGNTGDITCTAANGGYIGGILGYINQDTFGSLVNCFNYGKIISNSGGSNHPGAIIGWARKSNVSMISNNAYLETAGLKASSETNGEDHAISATEYKAADFKSGKVAYMLNGETSNGVWKQNVNSDNYPNFSSLSVYAGYVCGSGSSEISYTNSASDLISTPSPEHNMENGICKNCGVYQSATNNNGVYEISNLGQLLWFADKVNGGDNGINGKLMNDINAEKVKAIGIGTSDKPYSGTFDGNGKTLTVALESSVDYVAPFNYIGGATIKNLAVNGTISTSKKFAAGIVGRVTSENATLESCVSYVTINSQVSGDGTHGGLVAVVAANSFTVNNCGFAGAINGSDTTNCGGLIGWIDKPVTINNSYVAASFNIKSGDGNTFSRNSGNATLNNCYYLNELDATPANGATQKTAKQFESGEVAYLLNGSKSTGKLCWFQTLGTDKTPAVSGKTVFFKDGNYYNNKTGDINGDGTVDILDLIRMKKNLAAGNITSDMDLNTDKSVDSLDLTCLRKFLLGLLKFI